MAQDFNDYKTYARACTSAGLQPMDKMTWTSKGSPLAPTGQERQLA
jgi:hypothetical protein